MKGLFIITSLIVVLNINISTCSASSQDISAQNSSAEVSIKRPDKALILAFMKSFNAIYQPGMTNADIDKHFAFMSVDLIEHHMSYNVVQSGEEGRKKSRAGLLGKEKASISYEATVESMVIGTETAVVVFNEDAHYFKRGKKKHFKGRTILVLEFNQQAKIAVMRRYQD